MPVVLPSGNIQYRLVSDASVEVVLMQGQPALPGVLVMVDPIMKAGVSVCVCVCLFVTSRSGIFVMCHIDKDEIC